MSKILILSTGDVNGAYEAAYRIAKFAKEEGHEVALVVKYKTKPDKFIISIPEEIKIYPLFTRVLNKLSSKLKIFAPEESPEPPATNPKYLFINEDETRTNYSTDRLLEFFPFTPDLIIVGMVNGFVTTTNLAEIFEKTKAKIALVTADMYPLTGGCHYAWDCRGYETDCDNCPAIIDKSYLWWPKKNLEIKKQNVNKAFIDVISMSGWSNIQIRKSALFYNKKEILQINSCIDITLFNRENREIAKSVFNLPNKSKVFFIGSQSLHDERKGVQYIVAALKELYNNINEQLKEEIIVILIGRDLDSVKEIKEIIPFKSHFIEYINDYRLLSLLYQATDIFICGSIEDTGPMMVSEALACGTPVVGFDTGIVYNMVIDGENGYKAPVKNVKAMANSIKKILESSATELERMSVYAFEKVKRESSKEAVTNALNTLLS